jgi:hypothetical protein
VTDLETLALDLAPLEVGALAGGDPRDPRPLNDDAEYCHWVSGCLQRTLTDIERELVLVVCIGLGIGPWNVHRDWSIMKSNPHYASISVRRNVSTVDANHLTQLVFAAHDRCVRLCVEPSGPGRLGISVTPRSARDGRLMHRHPTLEAAVANWRARWPLEKS